MSLTIDPSIEACRALVTRINSGTAYSLAVNAEYSEQFIDPLEEINGLRVDVATDESETLIETLAVEDRTSHQIRVWIRSNVVGYTSEIASHVNSARNAILDKLKLLVRQIFQRVSQFQSLDRRVLVWECDNDQKQSPTKDQLNRAGLFVASILLRVEVEPS